MIINMWVAVGTVLYGRKKPTSPPVSTDGCLKTIFNSSLVTEFPLVNNTLHSYVSSEPNYTGQSSTQQITASVELTTSQL